jgi:hypothetical protein
MQIALDLQQLIIFFVFVVPGFLFTRTYLSFRPRYFRETSLFEQAALALVGSAIIHATLLSAVAVGILSAWGISGQTFTLDMLVGMPLSIGSIPLPILAFYLYISAGYVLLTMIVARRAGIFFGRRLPAQDSRFWKWWARIIGENPPENLQLWYTILQQEALQKGILTPKMTIRLRNGDTFEGYLNRLKLVGDEENTIELAITDVRCYPASNTATPILLEDQIVLLQSKDILWLSRTDTVSAQLEAAPASPATEA